MADDCAGASAGSDGDAAGDHAAVRCGGVEEEVWAGYSLFRRRAGDCYGGGELSLVAFATHARRHLEKLKSCRLEREGPIHSVAPAKCMGS